MSRSGHKESMDDNDDAVSVSSVGSQSSVFDAVKCSTGSIVKIDVVFFLRLWITCQKCRLLRRCGDGQPSTGKVLIIAPIISNQLVRDTTVPASDFKTQYNSHRGETWYELFYDLVFVASALQIGYIVKYNISFMGLLKSGIIFTVMRATWDQLMFYQNKFDTKDMVHFVFYLIQAMLAFVMALHLTLDHDHNWDQERNLKPFALAAALARVAIIFMYFQVMSLTKKYRNHLRLLVISQCISAVLFFVSAYATKNDNYFYLWLASILIERGLVHTFIAVVVPRKQRAPPHFGHLSHRQGTFVLLILGEAIIQLVQSSCGQNASAYARGLMGFAIIFNVGDVYYQQQLVGRLTFLSEKSTPYTTLWTALHLMLSLSMLFFAVGVKMVYSNECETKDRLQKEEFFMCVSASVSIIIISFLRMTHKGIWYKGKRVRGYSYLFRFIVALLCAFIPYVTHNALSSIGLLFGLTSCLVMQVERAVLRIILV